MLDNPIRTTPTSPRRPPRRLKQIFCPKHKVQDEPEMSISPPIMDHPMYSLLSPTFINNRQQHQKPMALNSVPPRVSSMPKRMATVQPSQAKPKAPHPPRKSTSRPSPAKEDRRHSFHLTNASATSVRTAPVASTIVTTSSTSSSSSSSSCSSGSTTATSSRFANLGNKRQSRAAASVAASSVVSPIKSRSTPLRVKTYNVNYDPKVEKERQRKRKELEELIAGGRRGSTVKLTLTPRNIT
ncbi:hypothetical protein BX666DRAFT_561586 [Dichotomocladium elegans]|nr:hypothetical protein BX666DRAFT_561586 [Dichotomocladium elegans]